MDDAGSKDELLLILIWLADVNQELEVWHTPAAALRPSWTVKLRHVAPGPAHICHCLPAQRTGMLRQTNRPPDLWVNIARAVYSS
jgi:hypothetical protein